MAYVNVAEWKPDQVTEWLKGLDSSVLPYVHSFLNNRINGQQLLGFGPNDLEHVGIHKIGHQEIVLEGIEQLRNIHYELDRENLQLLAMRLSCLAHSLHNELCHSHMDSQRLSTQILADIANIVSAVKPLIAWLDRPGFSGQVEYSKTRSEVLCLALRMATCGQRDRFAEAPVSDMKDASARLAKLSDVIVQEMTDPLILQPASLDLATVKKRSSDDLGFCIVPSFRGIHQISDLKLNSAAHQCGKIEPGDEIIQINYQTVVGWDVKNVMHLFDESPTEVLLTLKKRPRHTKVFGQIYFKPLRLPNKKRAIHSHGFTPRPEHLTRLQFRLPLHSLKLPTNNKIDSPREPQDSSSSDEEVPVQHKLVIPSKPVHRRATITGASPLSKRPPFDIHEFWHDLKLEKESNAKHSTTSVVDFEERLSSVDKNTMHSEDTLETLTIKQKIEMFSREQKKENPVVRKQVRVHSEPLFDDEALKEASRAAAKKFTDLEAKPLEKPKVEERKEVPLKEIQVQLREPLEPKPAPVEPLTEEHGLVVQTINRHLLSDINDELDLRESYGKNLDTGFDVDKCLASQRKTKINQFMTVINAHSLPERDKSSRLEPDSDLSRTISRVNTEDIINNKEQISSSLPQIMSQKNNFPPKPESPTKTSPKVMNIDKSCSNDCINKLFEPPRFPPSVSDPDGFKYNSLQDRHSRTRDMYDSGSAKSYSSSDYSEGLGRPTEPHPERQTLPKAGVKVSGQSESPPVPPPRPSLSKPPNACYRAIMAARSLGKASPKIQRKASPKIQHKKNSLLSKRRNVAVKDFPSVECDGWLLQRCRKGSGTWIKRWCLIYANTLYTFKSEQETHAETMVCLPGFTASPAEEVKSRQFAFKVYHTGTMFYFAAETNFELSVWLDAISAATLAFGPNVTTQIIYSESEGEDFSQCVGKKSPAPTPAPRPPVPQPTSPTEGNRMFDSLKKLSRASASSSNTGGSSLDRKCLRILGTGPLPVPTAQYRSYRRVHNTPPPSNSSTLGKDREHQDHTPLPPEMADYRLASLTAKTTPPVPRRRAPPREPLVTRRPHISAPIVDHSVLEDRLRRPQNYNMNDVRNPSQDALWTDSLRRDVNRKKIKSKKSAPAPSSSRHFHPEPNFTPETQPFPPDYPGLEYPPVFEPGTYTLDAMSLLPRTSKRK